MVLKTVEFFAGSRSFSRAAEKSGHKTFATDKEPFDGIDVAVDVFEFNLDELPYVPDVVWLSPPCTGFSVASIGKHWTGGKGAYIPKSETAKLGIRMVKRSLEIIDKLLEKNPDLIWYLENPVGVLRKLPFMQNIGIHHTVHYCRYGDKRMKPTDTWTNNNLWIPREKCKNGGWGFIDVEGERYVTNKEGKPCHVSAPRGAKTGTQGLKGNFERSMIPDDFCNEIIKASELGQMKVPELSITMT